MNGGAASTIGKQLWRLLPEVYRARDEELRLQKEPPEASGDLAKYLDSLGELLDRIHSTLLQRLDDTFPDTCQTWLLPYFAQLLDVRLISPHLQGQRREIAAAIAWRKCKGTFTCTEEIAEQVGNMEVEMQEGWKRVAVTARINKPLLPPLALGLADAPDMRNPLEAARYPGLEFATVDFRLVSRAEQVAQENAATHSTRFPGEPAPVRWQLRHPQGVPCFPGSYEDASKRTADLRTPDWWRGHSHPKRLLLYFPPPSGFFPPQAPSMPWENRNEPAYAGLWEREDRVETVDGQTRRTRIIRGKDPTLPLKITGPITLEETPTAGEDLVHRFENVYLAHTLTVKEGRLEIERVAAFKVVVHSSAKDRPAFLAKDCLLRHVRVARGLSQLESCTVLGKTISEILNASDCVFLGAFQKDLGDPEPPPGCIRYSRVPAGLLAHAGPATNTSEVPVFFTLDLGKLGGGALHPATPDSICFGGEDGGEMGAYHHRHHCRGRRAVEEKLKDFLPVGIRPVMIPDTRLACAPPK